MKSSAPLRKGRGRMEYKNAAKMVILLGKKLKDLRIGTYQMDATIGAMYGLSQLLMEIK